MSWSLPPRPVPRTRSGSRGGRDDEGDHRSPARSYLPPAARMPPPQNPRPQGRSQSSRGRMGDSRPLPSTSSLSESSFLDRMKKRSEPSSRTSVDDDHDDPPRRSSGWAPARGQTRRAVGEQDTTPSNETTAGYGYDLWGRVTAAAGNLTVNVSKAWETSIRIADGEETPPGGETRLTKAMKAYHLDRARSPADLPAWLFDEHERGAAPRTWSTSKPEAYEERFPPTPEPGQRSGLRDIYDRATISLPPSLPGGRQEDMTGPGGSRAANRLKAIREAKRSALQTRSEPEPRPAEDEPSRHTNDQFAAEPRKAPRAGLPAGPGRMRSR